MRVRFVPGVAALTLGCLLAGTAPSRAQQNPVGLAVSGTAKIADTFLPLQPGEVSLRGGMLGTRVAVNEKNRLLNVDENDMLDAFEQRDKPHQDWQGEHVGKFLHAATLAWANTQDPLLKTKLDRVVARLLKTQEPDGYLGTYAPNHRWTSWDVWVHKYDLLGLLTYYQFTHDAPDPNSTGNLSADALKACRRIGDLLIKTFGTEPGQRDINKSGEHVGMAPDSVLEPVVLLYRATNEPRYLKFARYIVSNYDAPGGPAILASLEKYGTVRKVANAKAYEMTSNFNGLLELYRATGEKRLLDDMLTAWQDIVDNRLYLTGSASSFEHFQDDFHLPNSNSANICETCVTVTWEQMNMELLRLTGEPRFADQIEKSAYNHLLGAQKPTGDDWAYYTPLEGHKPYDNFTTCCHSSGPRGVALLPEIAYMTGKDGSLIVNLYNSGTATAQIKSGKVTITQETNYPLDGKIVITVTPERNGAKFPLLLRVPAWATGAELSVNDKPAPAPLAGSYATLERRWKKGDTVTLDLAMPARVAFGDHGNEDKVALLYGPLVLTLDTALNPGLSNPNRAELLTDDSKQIKLTPAPDQAKAGEPVFMTEGKISGEDKIVPLYLTPYATAGQDGKSRYEVWVARPGKAAPAVSGSFFEGEKASYSRAGNQNGDITDGDPTTFRVTFNNEAAAEDWFAVTRNAPMQINHIVFMHGKAFHDGGWFDASAGKPRIQVQTEKDGEWKTLATLDTYPATTATDSAGLKDGQMFTLKFPAQTVVGIRVVGKPASGDNPAQAFSSCAELQAFFDK